MENEMTATIAEKTYLWLQLTQRDLAWRFGEWNDANSNDHVLQDLQKDFFALWLTTSDKSPLNFPETIIRRIK
jgi:hypothetical protein